MPWIDYTKAPRWQQNDFRDVNPQLAPHYDRFKVWITRDGLVSLRRGHWEWTDKQVAIVEENMRKAARGLDVRTRGDLVDYKTCDFHLDRPV